MGRANQVTDPYQTARFSSLWQVVTHATPPEADRKKAYAKAWQAMVSAGRWGDYRMVYHTLKSGHRIHVGYDVAKDTDWFMIPEGGDATRDVDGPFPSKNTIKRRLGVKTTTTIGSGRYKAAGHIIFTRAMAETVLGRGVDLP